MKRKNAWLLAKKVAYEVFQILFLLAFGFVVIVGTATVVTFLQAFYAPVETYSDFLSATSVIIAAVALCTTAMLSWKSWSILQDEYQPVPSVSYENLPAEGHPETIVTVANVGKRNLHISAVKVTGTWFSEEISPGLEVSDVAPGEEVPLVLTLHNPLPGLHTLRIELKDEENDRHWKKVTIFRVEAAFDLSVRPERN